METIITMMVVNQTVLKFQSVGIVSLTQYFNVKGFVEMGNEWVGKLVMMGTQIQEMDAAVVVVKNSIGVVILLNQVIVHLFVETG